MIASEIIKHWILNNKLLKVKFHMDINTSQPAFSLNVSPFETREVFQVLCYLVSSTCFFEADYIKCKKEY